MTLFHKNGWKGKGGKEKEILDIICKKKEQKQERSSRSEKKNKIKILKDGNENQFVKKHSEGNKQQKIIEFHLRREFFMSGMKKEGGESKA